MELRQLKYFVAISEDRSLSRAAARIGIAQPSLSQHVKSLEAELGVDLLTRTSRGVIPTEAGELLVTHARIVLDAISETYDALADMNDSPQGLVKLGVPSSVSMALSVPLVESLRLSFPKVQLHEREAMSGQIQDWLKEGTLDLAILYDVPDAARLNVTPLLSEDLYFYAATDAWPLATPPGKPTTLQDIAPYELVLPTASQSLRQLIDREVNTSGLKLIIGVEMDSLSQITEFVSRGSIATILAPAAVCKAVSRAEITGAPIKNPTLTRKVCLVSDPNRVQRRATKAVADMIIEVVQDLVKRGIWKVS